MAAYSNFDRKMKDYEMVNDNKLQRKVPVILRIDGCHFHTLTKNFIKPFDENLISAMQNTMKYLCENVQGCVFSYQFSDEITLVLIDYQNENTDAWYGYRVQKLCSVTASMATMKFNQELRNIAKKFANGQNNYLKVITKAISQGAYFDCRAYNVPKKEVSSVIDWRLSYCMTNSIQSLGRAYYSHEQLVNLPDTTIKCMLHKDYDIDWNALPYYIKYGSVCIHDDLGWAVNPEKGYFPDYYTYLDKQILKYERT